MKEIQLTQGQTALLDDEDYDVVSQYKWYASRNGNTFYAMRRDGRRLVSMHSMITGFSLVDHRDGDGLNNQRANLRKASHAQNMQNQMVSVNNTSGYKGVHFAFEKRKWQARIMANGKRISLGLFATPEEAALAYNDAAERLHGEFARLNVNRANA
jgi:hypothetical protein